MVVDGPFSKYGSDGLKVLEEMSKTLNVPCAFPSAAKIYTNAVTRYSEMFARKNTMLLCACCLMIPIKRMILPISRKEVIKVFGLKEKLFNRLYKQMISLCSQPLASAMSEISSGEKYIDRWAKELKLPEDVRLQAKKMIKQVETSGILNSRQSNTVAASVLYRVCLLNNCKKSYEEIAYLSKTDPSTVRSAVALLGHVGYSTLASTSESPGKSTTSESTSESTTSKVPSDV